MDNGLICKPFNRTSVGLREFQPLHGVPYLGFQLGRLLMGACLYRIFRETSESDFKSKVYVSIYDKCDDTIKRTACFRNV